MTSNNISNHHVQHKFSSIAHHLYVRVRVYGDLDSLLFTRLRKKAAFPQINCTRSKGIGCELDRRRARPQHSGRIRRGGKP